MLRTDVHMLETPTCTDGCCTPSSSASSLTSTHRKIQLVAGLAILYNIVEAIVAISAGAASSSVALIGFGLDSTIEVASAVAVMWQFSRVDPQRWERLTLKIIAVAFFALAIYVSTSSLLALSGAIRPEHSTIGLVLTCLSVVIMPALSLTERNLARRAGSTSALADSKQTLLCTYLSVAVLIGLAMNSLWQWWWADPLAGLFIAAVALREGWEAWQGKGCCAPTAALNPSGEGCEA